MACGSPVTSYIFFICFNILVFQIFINLFVAIIIDAFLGETHLSDLPIPNYTIEEFRNIWSEYDPLATGYIDIEDLERFIIRLAESRDGHELIIMHEEILKNPQTRRRFVALLNVPMYN